MNLKSYLELAVSDDDIDLIFDIKGSKPFFPEKHGAMEKVNLLYILPTALLIFQKMKK